MTGEIDLRPSKLASSMLERLLLLEETATINQPCAINRVPPNIRQCHANAYEPQILSIGPYHHGKPKLQSMEEHKWRYLRDLLTRNLQKAFEGHSINKTDTSNELEKLIMRLKELEPVARRCYPENISLGSDEFVMMMVLDGCFIVELLIKFYKRDKEDPLFAVAWILPLIRRDLLKLENQIPFFVLQNLFNLAKKPLFRSRSGEMLEFPTLKETAFSYLTWKKCEDLTALSELEVYHLLHLHDLILLPTPNAPAPISQPQSKKGYILPMFRSSLHRVRDGSSRSSGPNISGEWPTSTIPSATELQEAGIRFKCKKADSFIDVEFKDGVLEIPRLSVVDNTDSIFRNLLAFEQCCPDATNSMKHFTGYALLMDCMVNTPRDVAILKEHGIIENKLGSEEEVAALLNQLCKEIIIPYRSHRFAKLFERVNKYCGSNWHKNRARLRRDYFRNPWTSISVAAAAILLGLTFMQVVYAGLSYSCPRR